MRSPSDEARVRPSDSFQLSARIEDRNHEPFSLKNSLMGIVSAACSRDERVSGNQLPKW